MTQPLGGFTQIPVGPVPVQICPPLGQGQSVTIYNQDVNNVVTIGTSPGITPDASNGVPLQPLTPGTFPASKALYGVAPAGTASLVIIPEGGTLSPSPAQIAAQIAASGLATAALQTTQMATGIPPNVPNVGSWALDNLTPAVSYTLHTFTNASRLWYGSLGLAVATDNTSYASGLMRIFAQMLVGGNPVRTAQCAIGGTGEAMESHRDITFGGLSIPAGTSVTINVNAGIGGIAGLYITASADILGSTP
jgi:hypothetical protein